MKRGNGRTANPEYTDEMNFRRVHPRMSLFLVSKQMHEEAYRVFYAQPIRLFPRSGRFFHTKKPLLQRLPFKYREAVNTLELRLGPGFTAPPRCQNTLPSLGLADCLNMRTLKVFVECDPSDPVFAGFRGANSTEETYKWFCVDLLVGILQQVPSLETIEIDAYPSVKKNAPLVSALVNTAQDAKKKLAWGPQRCWEEDDKPMIIGLKGAMASMTISNNEIPRAVAVRA